MDCRHVIHALRPKPQALAGPVCRKGLFPRTVDVHAPPAMLTALRLPGIHRHWSALAERADKEGWPAARFLAALATLERAERETRTTDLVQKLQAARRDLAPEAALTKLDRFDPIILDDTSDALQRQPPRHPRRAARRHPPPTPSRRTSPPDQAAAAARTGQLG